MSCAVSVPIKNQRNLGEGKKKNTAVLEDEIVRIDSSPAQVKIYRYMQIQIDQ